MRILIWILVGYLVYRMLRMLRAKAAPVTTKESVATETFQDPVCGVFISEDDAVVGNLEGKRYHFCSTGCLQQFQEKIQQQK